MQNHIVASFGPDDRFSRHSEGAFLRLKDGRIFFAYSRFIGGHSDDSPSDLAAAWSSDEGETWSEPVTILRASEHGAKNVMSVSLLRMQNGDLGMFYIVKQAPSVNRLFLARSSDEGRTFYRRVECTLPDRPGYYELNNDRVERLQSGRILLPLALYRGGYEHGSASIYWDSRACMNFLYSDDDGETWQEARDFIYPPFPRSRSGLQEVGALEKKNGVVWAYARTDMMYQYESFSMDGGNTWTQAQPSRFTSPESPMKLKRRPETGDIFAVWNPAPNYNGRGRFPAGWGRTPIVWAVSHDDGASWSESHVIEAGPENGYCYPAMFFTNDGAMLAAYCAGGPEDGICLTRLNICKIAI